MALQNARLYALAVTDELTRLSTSRHFGMSPDDSIRRYERQQEPFALLFMDIDNFKQINDTFGHVVGDEVLRRVADAIAGSMGERDMAFRYGGEEVTVLLPGAVAAAGVEIVVRADAALYAAKRTGENRVVRADRMPSRQDCENRSGRESR